MNENIILDLVIYHSTNDLLVMTKLSLISKSFHSYLQSFISKYKTKFIKSLENIPIKQEYVNYYMVRPDKTDKSYNYTNYYIKQYIGRRLNNIWEIAQFNVYLIIHTNLYAATRKKDKNYDVFRIDSNGIIRVLPSNNNTIYCEENSLILRKEIKDFKYKSLLFPIYNKQIELISNLMHKELIKL
jgi:hypothetical protein